MFLVPNLAEDLFAVREVSTVGAEDFKSNGAVVTDGLQRANAMDRVHGSRAQWQMQIGATALVIVQMDVLEAFSICVEQLVGRIDIDEQVGVANIEMKRELRHTVHQLANLPRGIVGAGQVFNHQSNAQFA